ncbi:MAG TPA: alpha/beta hydrolase [Thermoleophilaceae bacterium]|nr:alpha/beta hydrolase [Thermoleophilaceae bacterium]
MERKEVRLRDGTIAYWEAGSGPPLLFVHGVLVNHLLWSKLIPLLSDRYRCIAPDWPLGSHSIPLDADLSPYGVADMVHELAGELALEKPTLVGNDTGGALCQMAVVRHPELASRMVLTNCDAYDKFPPQPFTYLVWVPHIPGAITLLAYSMRLRATRRLPIAYGGLSKRLDRETEEAFVRPVLEDRAVRRDIAGFLRAANKRDLMAIAERYGEIQIPVTLAWGEDDRAFKIEFAERMARDMPNAELHRIPDSKTLVPIDQPERLAAVI